MINKIKSWVMDYDRMFNVLVINILMLLVLMNVRAQSYAENYQTIINFMYWTSFVVFLGSSFIALKSADVNHTYGSGGHLSNWYDSILSCNGADWFKEVFDKLSEKQLISFKDKFVFTSPTANKGTYEKALFEYLCSKNIPSKFIISDLNIIENHQESSKLECGEYIYLDGSNDAKLIGENIKKANEDKVNAIYDSMGYLWHTKEALWHKRRKLAGLELEILKTYNAVLDANGLIIVDNTKSPTFQAIMRQVSHFLAHLKFGAPDISTGSYFLEICNQKRDSELKKYINQNFELHIVEALAKDKTTLSFLIFKKKIQKIDSY